ncbi:hypothetical protein M5E87_03425 [Flavonifractor plautii]|nr:hypothetical protein M5E87_03425 [Flavonifractor plautii]
MVGLSGGLDSTLAILITSVAMRMMDRYQRHDCRHHALLRHHRAHPGQRRGAGRAAGATLRRIDIGAAVRQHFKDIGQSMDDHDVTFENSQARERTQVLMDVANQCGGLVVGTGDLSELALGWATYNGDHMSMYSVNASIPKTLVRRLVSYVAGDKAEEDEALSHVLSDILDTPVSPNSCPPSRGRSPRRPRIWWAPTSCTTSSSTMPSAGPSRHGRCSGWLSTPSAAPTPGPSCSNGCVPSTAASSPSSSSAPACLTDPRWARSASLPGATGACPPTPWRPCGWRSWRGWSEMRGMGRQPPASGGEPRLWRVKRFGAAKTLPQAGLIPAEDDRNRGPHGSALPWGGTGACPPTPWRPCGWRSWRGWSEMRGMGRQPPASGGEPRLWRVKRFGAAKTLPQAGLIPAEDDRNMGSPWKRASMGRNWRMPSDAVAALWLEELEGLE